MFTSTATSPFGPVATRPICSGPDIRCRGRPPSAGPATVACYLDGRLVGQATVTSGFNPYRFAIPADLAAAASSREDPVLLRIVAAPWSPKTVLGTGDTRTLGVMVQRVAVQ